MLAEGIHIKRTIKTKLKEAPSRHARSNTISSSTATSILLPLKLVPLEKSYRLNIDVFV